MDQGFCLYAGLLGLGGGGGEAVKRQTGSRVWWKGAEAGWTQAEWDPLVQQLAFGDLGIDNGESAALKRSIDNVLAFYCKGGWVACTFVWTGSACITCAVLRPLLSGRPTLQGWGWGGWICSPKINTSPRPIGHCW